MRQTLKSDYNILYLMHGWRMTAGDFFNYSDLITILDNMNANGALLRKC